LLSQAVGKPVRVQWMRHDEHGWEPISPAMAMDVRVGLDEAGNVVAWDFEQWSPSHSISEKGNFRAWRLLGTAPGWDRLSSAPGLYSYVFPNTRQTANYVQPFLRTIYLRAPGRIQHNFASESFMDEVAEAVGVDPVEYRLRHLQDPGAIAVVKRAASEAKWEPRTVPRKKMAGPKLAAGRGFAFGEHAEGQQIALVADVTVNLDTAEIRVPRIVAVSQCGLIINPEGLRHQVQGAIIQGLSRSLLEELKFDTAAVSSLDWNSYPILKFSEVPVVDVTLINQPDRPSSGAGETATIPVAAAIGNAICDATGIRLRQVPLRTELRKRMTV
jgi:CO/xanthine dehydrogenase Mo-binding subunit